jgi:hypothetical protein
MDVGRTGVPGMSLLMGGRVGDLAIEFIATFVAIAGIALADLLLKWWLGEGKKFLGLSQYNGSSTWDTSA